VYGISTKGKNNKKKEQIPKDSRLNFDEDDLTPDEMVLDKQFNSFIRFKNADAPPRPAHDLQKNTLDVFEYEDSKDKETEDLDGQFIRLGRFKTVSKKNPIDNIFMNQKK